MQQPPIEETAKETAEDLELPSCILYGAETYIINMENRRQLGDQWRRKVFRGDKKIQNLGPGKKSYRFWKLS